MSIAIPNHVGNGAQTSRLKIPDALGATAPPAEPLTAAFIIDVRRATTALDLMQVALILGEQRAWAEQTLRMPIEAMWPDARAEYAVVSEHYMPPTGTVVLGRLDGEPVGVMGVRALPRGRSELKRVYVRPRARGLGVGRRLLRAAIEAAGELGFLSLYAETVPHRMEVAAELFARAGFEETICEHPGVDRMIALELLLT